MGYRVSDESQRVSLKQTEVAIALNRLEEEFELTTAEMLHAVAMWQAQALRWAIMEERTTDPDHKVEHEQLKRKLSGG